MTESTVAQGQQLLPLIDHLARVGRRAADTCGTGCLRPRHLIALKLIGEHGSLTQHALGAALSLDPSNVVGLLNELEDRDLITRRRDPADRRRHIVALSDSGSAELASAYREFGAVEDDLFKMLTAEERTTLYTLLSRAVAALAPACETAECTAAQPELSLSPARPDVDDYRPFTTTQRMRFLLLSHPRDGVPPWRTDCAALGIVSRTERRAIFDDRPLRERFLLLSRDRRTAARMRDRRAHPGVHSDPISRTAGRFLLLSLGGGGGRRAAGTLLAVIRGGGGGARRRSALGQGERGDAAPCA